LQSLSITEYDAVVVGITDIEASLTIAQMLRDLGVKHIVCKAKSPVHGKILVRIGVDRVIYPERDMGMRVAQTLVASSILGSIVLSPQQHIVTVLAPESCIGHPVGTFPWRTETKIAILAIHRGTEAHANPGATFVIQKDDVLVLLGSSADIATVVA
jgi:trk system potassium uptake protein TrkA